MLALLSVTLLYLPGEPEKFQKASPTLRLSEASPVQLERSLQDRIREAGEIAAQEREEQRILDEERARIFCEENPSARGCPGYQPPALSVAVGQASWYGPGFHGRRTANGEVFNQNALTAAHRTLPFGTLVRVTNLRNNRQVVVRINDRGPFVGGRIIDLSAGSARQIGMISSGVAAVQIEILQTP
jgi:rare lipoprotein A (peptidoglycan hydrolase)